MTMLASHLCLACGIVSEPISDHSAIELRSGNEPIVVNIMEQSAPLRFSVKDRSGNPAIGAMVTISLESLPAKVLPRQTTTDAIGNVEVSLEMGALAGVGELILSGDNIAGQSHALRALPARPQIFSVAELKRPTLPPGAIDYPLHLQVFDRYLNPITNTPFIVELESQGVTLLDNTLASDVHGRLSIPLTTLGALPGEHQMTFTSPNFPNLLLGTLALTLESGTPSQIEFHQGATSGSAICNSLISAGTVVPSPLTVQVTDAFGNPVGDQLIVFTTSDQRLELSPWADFSDRLGLASTVVSANAVTNTSAASITATLDGSTLSASCATTLLP